MDLPGRGMAIAYSPDGRHIAVGGHFRDGTTGLRYDTKIYDTATAAHVKSFDCHYYWVIGIDWKINPFLGEVIADGGYDHAVKIWNANGSGSTTCNPGQFLPEEGALQRLDEIDGAITAVAFSPDGRYLAGVARDRAVRIWKMDPGTYQFQVIAAWYDEPAGNFLSVAWAPDGKHIVTGDKQAERIAVWPFSPETDTWDDAATDAYAKLDMSQTASWFVNHPEWARNTPVWSEGGHGSVWNVRYSPDGKRVAAAGADGTLSIFDAADGTVVFRANSQKNTPLNGMDWNPNGRVLAAGGADGNIYLHDANDGALLDTLTGHADVVTALAFSADGCSLASTAGGKRVSTVNEIHTLVEGPDQTARIWSKP